MLYTLCIVSVNVVTDITEVLHPVALTITDYCSWMSNNGEWASALFSGPGYNVKSLRQCERFVTGSTLNEAGWAGRAFPLKNNREAKYGEAMERNSHGWVKLVKSWEIQIFDPETDPEFVEFFTTEVRWTSMDTMDTRQAQHLVQVQCLRPFLQPARYAVEFLGGNLGEISSNIGCFTTCWIRMNQI